ncbi:MAG: HNH endonuclease [Nanoarchaeota archaeon]
MRDYKQEYKSFHGKPEQIKNRAKRNAARALLTKLGRVAKGDSKDVGHKIALKSGGSNNEKNLRVETIHTNRGRK